MVLMSAQVVLHAPKAVQDRLLQPVLTALLPWTLHHHHSLRSTLHLIYPDGELVLTWRTFTLVMSSLTVALSVFWCRCWSAMVKPCVSMQRGCFSAQASCFNGKAPMLLFNGRFPACD